jgi:hypothetical protein
MLCEFQEIRAKSWSNPGHPSVFSVKNGHPGLTRILKSMGVQDLHQAMTMIGLKIICKNQFRLRPFIERIFQPKGGENENCPDFQFISDWNWKCVRWGQSIPEHGCNCGWD